MIKSKIIQNSFFLSTSAVINRLLKLLLIPLAVSILGPHQYGIFNYAISLVALFFILSDLGTGSIFLKDTPFESKKPEYISTFVSIRLLLLFGLSACSFLLYFWIQDPAVKSILLLIQGLFFLNKGSQLFQLILQSLQKMHHSAIADVIQTSITTGLGIAVLKLHLGLFYFALAYLIGSAASFCYLAIVTMAWFPKKLRIHWPTFWDIARHLLPFFIVLASSTLLIISDSLMIKWFYDAESLGIYKSMSKLTEVIVLPCMLFIQALIPSMAGLAFKPNIKQFSKKSIAVIVLYATPVAGSLLVIGLAIIDFLYGSAYASGVSTLQLLGVSVLVSPLLVLINYLLLMHNLYRESIFISFFSTLLNVALNLLLIPKFWITGAAIATVIAMSTDLILSTLLFYRRVGLLRIPIRSVIHAIGATAIMLGVLAGYFSTVPLIVAVGVGALIYAGILFLVKDVYFIEGIVSLYQLIRFLNKRIGQVS